MIGSSNEDESDKQGDVQIISAKKYPKSKEEYRAIERNILELNAFSSVLSHSKKLTSQELDTEADILILEELHHQNVTSTESFITPTQIPQGLATSSRADTTFNELDAAMARVLQQEEYNRAQPQSISFQRQAMVTLGLDEATINGVLME